MTLRITPLLTSEQPTNPHGTCITHTTRTDHPPVCEAADMTPHMVAEDMVILVLADARMVVSAACALQAGVIEDIHGATTTEGRATPIVMMTTIILPLIATTMETMRITTEITAIATEIPTGDITTRGILMGPIVKMNQIGMHTNGWSQVTPNALQRSSSMEPSTLRLQKIIWRLQ